MDAKEYFNKSENLQPGLADKFVHGYFDDLTWDEFIERMAPYFEEYSEAKNK